MKISKPSAEELRPLLSQATQEGDIPEDEWHKTLITGFAKMLRKSPLQYRCFGPYWWIFKSLIWMRAKRTLGQEWMPSGGKIWTMAPRP